MGLLPYFFTIIEHSPPSHQSATIELGDTANVIEDMLRVTRFELPGKGTVEVINEWPDVDTAIRGPRCSRSGHPRHRGRWLRQLL